MKASQHIIDELDSELDRLKRAKYALERFSLDDIEIVSVEFKSGRKIKDIGKLLGVSANNVSKMLAAERYLRKNNL
ncbi:TPA: hypothetical protein ACX6RX_003183 [Photobacterium damselae]